ncbi:hypothetical protein NDU88_006747, partial [Pleurodeles waltl]
VQGAILAHRYPVSSAGVGAPVIRQWSANRLPSGPPCGSLCVGFPGASLRLSVPTSPRLLQAPGKQCEWPGWRTFNLAGYSSIQVRSWTRTKDKIVKRQMNCCIS